MTGREAARLWEDKRRQLRERAAHLTPKVLTNYPFEVMVATIAVLMGLPFLIGAAVPASLISLVGSVAFYFWSAALFIGGATIAVSLRIGDRPNPLVCASGLQLAAGCFGIYALAVVIVLGMAGLTGLAAYVCLALLALVRATHFRRIVDIQRGARRAGRIDLR